MSGLAIYVLKWGYEYSSYCLQINKKKGSGARNTNAIRRVVYHDRFDTDGIIHSC